jgi:hypothetical protein
MRLHARCRRTSSTPSMQSKQPARSVSESERGAAHRSARAALECAGLVCALGWGCAALGDCAPARSIQSSLHPARHGVRPFFAWPCGRYRVAGETRQRIADCELEETKQRELKAAIQTRSSHPRHCCEAPHSTSTPGRPRRYILALSRFPVLRLLPPGSLRFNAHRSLRFRARASAFLGVPWLGMRGGRAQIRAVF